MSTFFLAAFFILFGIMTLIPDFQIPKWVLGAVALLVALALLLDWRKKP